MAGRLKLGIYSVTSCAGCQMRIIDLEKELPEIIRLVDIVHFPMAQQENYEGKVDIAFVEGCVVQNEEVDKIKGIRAKAKVLVALGTCASYGGVPAIKELGCEEIITKAAYHDPSYLDSINVAGIGKYVDVDYHIRGCPIDKNEFVKVVQCLLKDKLPKHINYPVCKECLENENQCILFDNKLCMGSLTYGGCDSVCLNNDVPCYGCRGPLDDGNVDAVVELLKEKGVTVDTIRDKFTMFAGTSRRFCDLYEKTGGKWPKP